LLVGEIRREARGDRKIPGSNPGGGTTFPTSWGFWVCCQLRVHFGWSGRSDVPSVYVHLSGRDVEEAILKIYGIEMKQKLPPGLIY